MNQREEIRKRPGRGKESWKPAIKGKLIQGSFTGPLLPHPLMPSIEPGPQSCSPCSLFHTQVLTLNSMGVYFSFFGVPPPL